MSLSSSFTPELDASPPKCVCVCIYICASALVQSNVHVGLLVLPLRMEAGRIKRPVLSDILYFI